MASRFYGLVFVALTGVLVIVSPTDLALMTVQAQTNQDRKVEADRLIQQGIKLFQTSRYREAILVFESALGIYGEIQDSKGKETSLYNIGNAYETIGQYQKAIGFYQKSLLILKQIGDPEGAEVVLNDLGLAYSKLSQYQKAIESYQESIAIAKKIGNNPIDQIINLGGIYLSLGKYQEAIALYQSALSSTSPYGRATVLHNTGIAYISLEQYQKAIDFFQQSLAISKQIGNRYGEASSLASLGSAYGRLGQYHKAINFFQQSLAIQKQIGNLYGEISSLGGLGSAYGSLGQYQKAINFFQQALAITKEVSDREYEGGFLYNLGLSFKALNQSELAILFYKQSINVTESIRKDIRGLDKDLQKSYLGTVEQRYRNLADLLLQQDRIIEALQVLDLLKVQELEDYLKNIKGSDRSVQGVRLLEPEKAVSDELLTVSFENAPALNQQLANQIQQLPKTEINKVPDYLNQIPQGTVLLYPFIIGDRLEIILFAPNNIPIRRTVNISQAQLEALISDFRNELRDNGSEDVKVTATELYSLLIKPIEPDLAQFQTQTILYAPDGILRYVPLAALYDGKQWFATKYRISNLIAYTLTDFSAQPKSSPNILAGAFGGKEGEKKHGQIALPATIKEVQAIANSFENSLALLENNFSRATTEAKFKNYNVLHFATHAEFNTGAPDNSFIMFGNGDTISLRELTDWQIPNVGLIVLSACQTGVGKLGSGVEILGFGYQIQKAGVKQAIASLWSVDDAGTQALMTAFYQELKQGNVSVAEALHRAQVSLIKSQNFSHPYYWSAFFAIGNGL